MANLASYQKLSRVLPGLPWGSGSDGSATISSDPNTRATITGTATQTTGTAGSTAFTNGDVVMLHQTQGTGAGQYEFNRILSGGGSTSLTFQTALNYTYGTGAQIIKIPMNLVATVNAHSVTAWNGTTGGIEIVCAKTSITVAGALSTSGLGFRGGSAPSTAGSAPGYSGYRAEGQNNTVNNAGNVRGGGQTGADGIAGAGGRAGGLSEDHNLHHSGGGGGHSTAGGNGYWATAIGGGTVGSADLIIIFFGGAGGAGSSFNEQAGQAGRNGSGIVILISKSITISGSINCNGVVGLDYPNSYGGAGGASAGGSALMIGENIILGTALATAIGGTSPVAEGGSTGGIGRIAVHHSGTVTGTTNPTFTDVTDATLKESFGGSFIFSLL